MIYEETYQYLLRNVSSTEFDTCLYALLHSDWDGVIQSPLHMMARGVGTTEKYLRQIVNKFTAPQGSLKKLFVSSFPNMAIHKFSKRTDPFSFFACNESL
ncbi:hypothetical protein V3595_22830 [Bacillus sp. CFBP9009]